MNIGLGVKLSKLQPQTATLSPLPPLPEGYAFLVDIYGNYLIDGSGNFLIGLI